MNLSVQTNSLSEQINDARRAGDWDKHSKLWEARRIAEVQGDESAIALLARATGAVK